MCVCVCVLVGSGRSFILYFHSLKMHAFRFQFQVITFQLPCVLYILSRDLIDIYSTQRWQESWLWPSSNNSNSSITKQHIDKFLSLLNWWFDSFQLHYCCPVKWNWFVANRLHTVQMWSVCVYSCASVVDIIKKNCGQNFNVNDYRYARCEIINLYRVKSLPLTSRRTWK